MMPIKKTIAENLSYLISNGPRLTRPQLAERMGIGDKTLGFAKAGTGNLTLETLDAIARYYRVEVWQLLIKDGVKIADKGRFLSENFTPLRPLASTLIREIIDAEVAGANTERGLKATLEVFLLSRDDGGKRGAPDTTEARQDDVACAPRSDSLDFQDVFYPSEAARKRVRESHSDPELKIPGQNEEPKSRQRGRRGSGAG